MQKFKITATKNDTHESISVMARCHQQHIYKETELVDVSKSGRERLRKFFKAHDGNDGWRIYIPSIPNMPKLIGF